MDMCDSTTLRLYINHIAYLALRCDYCLFIFLATKKKREKIGRVRESKKRQLWINQTHIAERTQTCQNAKENEDAKNTTIFFACTGLGMSLLVFHVKFISLMYLNQDAESS